MTLLLAKPNKAFLPNPKFENRYLEDRPIMLGRK